MDKKEYLNKLLDLKRFLKENPGQIKIYKDVRVDQLILEINHGIYLEEDNLYAQDRLYFDGFETTDFNPFL